LTHFGQTLYACLFERLCSSHMSLLAPLCPVAQSTYVKLVGFYGGEYHMINS